MIAVFAVRWLAVPYREELEAALARTAAAEDELASARSENSRDHERIAALEKELADARSAEKKVTPPPKARESVQPTAPTTSWQRLTQYGWTPLIPLVVVTVVFTDFVYKTIQRKKRLSASQVTDTVAARVEVMAEEARAKADARKLIADATLVKIETQSIVDASGDADLTKGFMTFDFYAPSKQHYIHVSTSGGRRQTNDFASGSGMRVHDPPHCNVQDVWAEAIRRGASSGLLASFRLSMTNDGPMWDFELAARPGEKAFTMTLPDECPLHGSGAP